MNGKSDYPPPPVYSPPGQDPPVQMQPSVKASAPPPPGMLTSPPPTQQTTVVYQTVTPPQFGPYPMRFTCPYCNAHVMTETTSTPGVLTWIISGVLCLVASFACCCLVPFCIRECKDIEHRCPNCHHGLGFFKRI